MYSQQPLYEHRLPPPAELPASLMKVPTEDEERIAYAMIPVSRIIPNIPPPSREIFDAYQQFQLDDSSVRNEEGWNESALEDYLKQTSARFQASFDAVQERMEALREQRARSESRSSRSSKRSRSSSSYSRSSYSSRSRSRSHSRSQSPGKFAQSINK